MPASSVPIFSTDPSVQAGYLQVQQRQALAAALMQDGLKPLDINNRQVGGVAYRVSPMEGLAKVLQAYGGQKMMGDSNQEMGNLLAGQNDALVRAMGGGQPTAQQPDPVTSTLGAGAASGSVGPTNENAARLASALDQGQQPPQAGPAGGGSPFNPTGLPPELAARAYLQDPSKYLETIIGQSGPTDIQKQAIAAGYRPGTPQYQQFLQTYLNKQTTDPKILGMRQAGMSDDDIKRVMAGEAQKNSTMAARPEQSLYTFNGTGAPTLSAVAPDAGNNMQFRVGTGGTISAQPVPGAVPNKANMVGGTAGASAAGTTAETLHEVTLPDGKKVKVLGKSITALPADSDRVAIYQGEMKAAQQRLAAAQTPDEKSRAQTDVDSLTREMSRAGIPQGQSTADKTTQEAGAKLMTELPMQIQQSKQTVTGLENAYRTIEAVGKSGPGVSKTVNALAILNNLGIPVAKDDANGYQTLKKFLENSASTAAASNGFTGSDARFEQFRAGQPNAESMNPDALKGAIRYVLSQHDANLARAQFIQKQVQANAGDPNAAMKAQQQWSQAYSPRVFEFSRMTPPERAQVKSGMNQSQRAQFGQQYNFAHEQGWVQ